MRALNGSMFHSAQDPCALAPWISLACRLEGEHKHHAALRCYRVIFRQQEWRILEGYCERLHEVIAPAL